jgi:hypothetical protein
LGILAGNPVDFRLNVTIGDDCLRNSAAVGHENVCRGQPKDGLENTEMNAPKAPEQKQQQQQGSTSQATNLNDRYGKIGISAVAGAVAHKPEQPKVSASRFTTLDSD